MNNKLLWLNTKIEESIHFWYYWIGIIIAAFIVNNTLLIKIVPYEAYMIILGLLFVITLYYIKTLYEFAYKKYKLQINSDKSKILNKIKILEYYIEEISSKTNEKINDNHTEVIRKSDNIYNELSEIINKKEKDQRQFISKELVKQNENNNSNFESLNQKIEVLKNDNINELTKIKEKVNKLNNQIINLINKKFKQRESNSNDRHIQTKENINRVFSNIISELERMDDNIIESSKENMNQIIKESKENIENNTSKLSNEINIKSKELLKIINNNSDNQKKFISKNLDEQKENINSTFITLEKLNKINAELIEKSRKEFSNLNAHSLEYIDDNFEEIKNNYSETKIEIKDNIDELSSDIMNKIEMENEDILINSNNNKEIVIKKLSSILDNKSQKELSEISKFYAQVNKDYESIVKKSDSTKKNILNKFKNVMEKIENQILENRKNEKDIHKELSEIIKTKFKNQAQTNINLSKDIINEINNLDNHFTKLFSLVNNIEKSISLSKNDLSEILEEIYSSQVDSDKSIKKLLTKHGHIDSKISNIQNQINILNSLVKVLKSDNITENDSKRRKKDPDRTEKIIDEDNNTVLFNRYKDNNLKKSEMKLSGKKMFETKYDSKGRISSSINYNEKGDVTIKNFYYTNGQIKKRIENVNKNGELVKQIKEFNKKGIEI